MAERYDVVVIGAGLGGLIAAALLARAGRKVLVLERNASVGGAASTYKMGDLVIEGSLHETADPRDPFDPKHRILERVGVLGDIDWVPVGALYEVRGGPVGAPFLLPDNFAAAREALERRFPQASGGIAGVLGDMQRIAGAAGAASRGRAAFGEPQAALKMLGGVAPIVRDWRRSLSDVFARAFAGNEAVKCALAANLGYYHDDPDTTWWLFFALAQGGFMQSGASFIRGGSRRLSAAIARAVKAAGGDILLRRQVSEIRLGGDGRPAAIVHAGRNGKDPVEAEAHVVVSNAAPALLADMLPEPARGALRNAYAAEPLSTSLFALTLGLSVPPQKFGLSAYSSILLPPWIKRLADFPRSADVFAADPGVDMPGLVVVDYSRIDSGLGGPPYPVSVVGIDRIGNWDSLDKPAYEDKRKRWLDAIVATIDAAFPGFASHITVSTFSTASTMQSYLSAPFGAVYGFAPRPPRGPIWRGLERSPRTPIPQLYLASSYSGSGGFSGALTGGGAAADRVLAET